MTTLKPWGICQLILHEWKKCIAPSWFSKSCIAFYITGPDTAAKLPSVTPHTKCKLKLLKQERIKDYLLMEEEFIRNQERLKPQEEKNEEERSKVDDLR